MHQSNGENTVAYFNGQWKPRKDIHWELHDVGPMMGAIAVERLRTFNQQLPPLELYRKRFDRSVLEVGASALQDGVFAQIAADLVEQNRSWVQDQGDVAVVFLASAGMQNDVEGRSTVMAFLEPLPWKRLSDYYLHGVSIVVSTVRNVPDACWPVAAKVRSRLHYFQAQREAQVVNSRSIALLPDLTGNVTDTALASLVVNRSGEWFAPTADAILPSVTQSRFESQLAEQFSIRKRPIPIGEMLEADEAVLLGTTGQIHAVANVDLSRHGLGGRSLPGIDGNAYKALLAAWKGQVGFDFEKQAIERASQISEVG